MPSLKTSKALQEARAEIARYQSEDDFQIQVIELARLRHFKVAHFRQGMTSRTYTNKQGEEKNVWITPVQGDGKGFPDLCLVRKDKIIFWECKKVGGKCSPEQGDWIELLSAVAKVTKRVIAGVINPEMWDYIEECLE